MADNQWVQDPNNPDRMTYTDADGRVHEATRDTAPKQSRQPLGPGIEEAATKHIPGVGITSRKRTAAHNKKVGGDADSFHLTDDARDFVPPKGLSMGALHTGLREAFPSFDVINEGDHVHIEPREGSILTAAPAALAEGTPTSPVASPSPAEEVPEGRRDMPGALSNETATEFEGIGRTDKTVIGDDEKALVDYAEKELFSGKPWKTISADLKEKYPYWFKENEKGLKYYYDGSVREKGPVPINWTKDPSKPVANETIGEDIVVEGGPKSEMSKKIDFLRDNAALGYHTGVMGALGRFEARVDKALYDIGADPEEQAREERLARAELEASLKNNDYGGEVSDKIMGFLAQTVGGAGPDYLLPAGLGKKALTRVMSAPVLAGGVDAALQGAENLEGVSEGFDYNRNALNALAGGVIQGAAEPFAKKFGRGLPDVNEAPAIEGVAPNAPARFAEDTPAARAVDEAVGESPAARPDEATPVDEAPTGNPDDGASAPIDADEVMSRMTDALRNAGKATDEQVAINERTRRERFSEAMAARDSVGGEAGYRAAKAKLEGEYAKVAREPIRPEFQQPEIDAVFQKLANHESLSPGQRFKATDALFKLLDGKHMQANEIAILAKTMPDGFVREAMKHRSTKSKGWHFLAESVNLSRALRSSLDLSVMFRQAWAMTTRKEFYKNVPSMFHQAFSETEFQRVMSEIRKRPDYDKMEESGLAFSDLNYDLEAREEMFQSNWAEKIPGLGRLIRGSGRGFTGFLNRLRADVWQDIRKDAAKVGKDVNNIDFMHELSGYVNNATGRGSLGNYEAAGPLLNGILFSPRLMTARLALLNPNYYRTLDPFIRKQAIKDVLGATSLATSVLTLAAANGADVELDPRSSDFGKIRVGNDRHDVLGGFGQYITFISRLATNKTMTSSGDLNEMGEGRFSKNRLEALGSFLRSKFSPMAGYFGNYLAGKNVVGEEFNAKNDTLELFTPMFAQDLYEVFRDEGLAATPKLIPTFFGTGYSSYNNAPDFDRLGNPNDQQGGRMEDKFFEGEGQGEVAKEVARLEKAAGKELFATVKKSDVKDFPMTDEHFYNYQYYAGAYIREALKIEMESPDWKNATDEDKVVILKDVVKDQKANARDFLFPEQ